MLHSDSAMLLTEGVGDDGRGEPLSSESWDRLGVSGGTLHDVSGSTTDAEAFEAAMGLAEGFITGLMATAAAAAATADAADAAAALAVAAAAALAARLRGTWK